MTTRYGREVVAKKCPNKKCRGRKRCGIAPSMNDIGSHDYVNCICLFCKCHYAGNVGEKLKFWTQEEWEEAIEKEWANS